VLLPLGVRTRAVRVRPGAPGAADLVAGGWECYLEDLFEAGGSVLTNGALDR